MNGRHTYGTVATVHCKEGYVLKGSQTSTCVQEGSSGKWKPVQKCEKSNLFKFQIIL